MGRLFAGTAWDRPPRCERCEQLESECSCPPAPPEPPKRIPPGEQTARLRLEKRPKGKLATVIANLDPQGNDLDALARQLKDRCGTGGTVKDGTVELQGDHLKAAEAALTALGYRTRRG